MDKIVRKVDKSDLGPSEFKVCELSIKHREDGLGNYLFTGGNGN